MNRALLIDLFALPEYDISLALGYLKAFADADPAVRGSWEISLLHLPVSAPAAEVAAAIADSGADLVGLSCYSWNIRAVERALALVPRKPGRLVALGGIEVTPDPVGYLRKIGVVDFIVFGEGEETFHEILRNLEGGAAAYGPDAVDAVTGVAWRHGRTIRKNPARPPIADLSTIPSPYLSGTYGALLQGQDRVMVETTRGCPYTCTFCFEPRGFARVRAFPVERAKAEIAAIHAAGGRERSEE